MEIKEWFNYGISTGILIMVLLGIYRLANAFFLGDRGVRESYQKFVDANVEAAQASIQLSQHIERHDLTQAEACNKHANLLDGVSLDFRRHIENFKDTTERIKIIKAQLTKIENTVKQNNEALVNLTRSKS